MQNFCIRCWADNTITANFWEYYIALWLKILSHKRGEVYIYVNTLTPGTYPKEKKLQVYICLKHIMKLKQFQQKKHNHCLFKIIFNKQSKYYICTHYWTLNRLDVHVTYFKNVIKMYLCKNVCLMCE